jgi:hypothetical protein
MSLMDRHFADMVSRLTTSTRYDGMASVPGYGLANTKPPNVTTSNITVQPFNITDLDRKEAPVATVPATFKLEPGAFYAAVIVPRGAGKLTMDSEFLGYAYAAGNSAQIREELRKQGTLSRLKEDSACVLIGAWITVTGDIASLNAPKYVSAVLVEECGYDLERSAWLYAQARQGNRDFAHVKPMAQPAKAQEAPAPVPVGKEAPAPAKKAPTKKVSKKKEPGVIIEPNTFYAAALVRDGEGPLRDEDIVAVTPAGEHFYETPQEIAEALGLAGSDHIPDGRSVVIGLWREFTVRRDIGLYDYMDSGTTAEWLVRMIDDAIASFEEEQRTASPTSSLKSLRASEPAVTPVEAVAPAIVATPAAAAAAIVTTPEPVVEPVITKQEPPMAATPSTPASTNPTDASTALTTHADWNRKFLSSGMEGAKDGVAAAAAELVTDATLKALCAAFPSAKMWVSIINDTDIGRATLLLLTPFLIGHLTLVMPGVVPGDPENVRAICGRASRAIVSGRFASFLTNLRSGLVGAFKGIDELSAD